MNIYIICPVRCASPSDVEMWRAYADALRSEGHVVHFPPDDAPQDDPTGAEICRVHRDAMVAADEVHVFWDSWSYGSHFDLGMAYALRKKIVAVQCLRGGDNPGKSYWKALLA